MGHEASLVLPLNFATCELIRRSKYPEKDNLPILIPFKVNEYSMVGCYESQRLSNAEWKSEIEVFYFAGRHHNSNSS